MDLHYLNFINLTLLFYNKICPYFITQSSRSKKNGNIQIQRCSGD